MIPTIGRIVHYRLSEQDAAQINKRRADATSHMPEHRENSNGVVIHIGNSVWPGDVYALVITRTWGGIVGQRTGAARRLGHTLGRERDRGRRSSQLVLASSGLKPLFNPQKGN